MNTPKFTKKEISKDKRYFCKEHELKGYPKESFYFRKVNDVSIPFLVQFSGDVVNTEKYCIEDDGNYIMYAYSPDGNLMHTVEFKGGTMIRICLKSYLGEWKWSPCGGNLGE